MTSDYAKYSMGSPEAWDPEEKENLEYNFYPLKQFKNIEEKHNMFLCGRRGSGKSAIALMLEAKSKYPFKEAIQGEVEQYGAYIDIVKLIEKELLDGINIDLRASIRRLWIWAIPVRAMQTLCNKYKEKGITENDNIKNIKNYFQTTKEPIHIESGIGHLLTQVFDTAFKSLKEEGESSFLKYLINLTQTEDFRLAFESLKEETKHHNLLLIFDTLESYKVFQPFMITSLEGILDALVSLRTDKRMEGISIKFFFPSEIYDDVIRTFPGKIQQRAVFLRWKVKELGSMLARRYLRVLERTQSVDAQKIKQLRQIVNESYRDSNWQKLRKEFWYKTNFLPEKVKNIRDIEEDVFAYIIRHSQRRPRDLIALMQSIVDVARENDEFPYISPKSIYKGIHRPHVQLQILQDSLIVFEGLVDHNLLEAAQSIFDGRPMIMQGREIHQFAQELYELYPSKEISPDDFIHALIRCGVIGLVLDEDPPKDKVELYCKTTFEYLQQGTVTWSKRRWYAIHPVMADAFHMNLLPDRGCVYPFPEFSEDTDLEDEVGI